MRLILATNHLGLGGSESYLLTVAEQFERLGHEVVIFSPEAGEGATVALQRGLTVKGGGEIRDDFDAALVQDPAVSFQIADCCPSAPQLFVAHSEMFNLQSPPQLDGSIALVVALNDRLLKRLGSFAVKVEVVRLRQPIDTERFLPSGSLPPRARRALLLSNTPHGDRLALLEEGCAEAEIELSQIGGAFNQTMDPRAALLEADIVIGYGRSILEAMACGRAAYVYDWNGGDGWMTAESYAEIEADGLSGRSGGAIIDPARLGEDLRRYSPSMGPINHDLVIAHHRASVHARELLELFSRLAKPGQRPHGQLQEMARLVRLEWRASVDAKALGDENARLHGLLAESQRRLAEAERAVDESRERAHQSELERHRAVAATVGAYEGTLSWRLGAPLRGAGRLIRHLRGDRSGSLGGRGSG